jgi:hypothetical protein
MTIEEVVRKALLDEHADVIRDAVKAVAAEMMELEVSELIGAGRGERRPEDRRRIATGIGRGAGTPGRGSWSCRSLSSGRGAESGKLNDPYTAARITFVRGGGSEVDIDNVVALVDAWQRGAQQWGVARRLKFANDPLNLLWVDASANREKSDGDAATWLPPNKRFGCDYVCRQIAVKSKFEAWVT